MLDMFQTQQRMPPHNLEAEQAVLGAMLIEADAIYTAVEELVPDDFYKNAHRLIFEAITDLFEKNEPIDLVTVGEILLKRNQLEKIGDQSYLTGVVNSIPTAANILYHSKIVHEKSILRRMISVCTKVIMSSYEAEDVRAVLDQAEAHIFDIAQSRETSSVVAIKDQILETFDAIEVMYQNQGALAGLPTGFKDLDFLCSGLQPSELIILAARPSMGKTALATAIVESVGLMENKGVMFFSLEMSKESLVQRMLCSFARVSSHDLKKGFLTEKGWVSLTNAASKLSQANIFIDDTPGLSILDMKTKARRIKAKTTLDLIVIDYLQLMQSYKKADNRQNEIADISRSLKGLARELKIPVIAVSQLSRAVESRTDKTPMLSDLRESGAIEQDADLVLMLMREEYYNPTEENKNQAQVIVGKNRNGPTGRVSLSFLKEYTRFEDISYSQERLSS
jgi:replicative DNA helicase